jgi:hypothetical protein
VIPIVAPPGTAGMVPSIALSYTKSVDNPLVGVGVSIRGLSVIHRCGRTIALDGVKGSVSCDSNDRLCLDGQRLISISSTVCGTGGTEYRTERETLGRVCAYGAQGSGPLAEPPSEDILRGLSLLCDRHRYHGVLAAPCSLAGMRLTTMAAGTAAQAPPERAAARAEDSAAEPGHQSYASSRWATRRARLSEAFPRVWPRCGADRRIIAFLTATASITRLPRFVLRLRLEVQGTPSLACPLEGAKLPRSFA